MLDHRIFLQDFEQVKAKLGARGVESDQIASLADWVDRRRKAIASVEEARHQQNEATAKVQALIQDGKKEQADTLRDDLKTLKAQIKNGEEQQRLAEDHLHELLIRIPNLPADGVPIGEDEASNEELRQWGTKPSFDFKPLPHWEIGEQLDILDFERASKMSGSRFVIYKGLGARLERALMNFMLDIAAERGYAETLTPLLVRPESMEAAGQYPKFEGDSFETLEREYCLIPTSEVPLVNLHRDEILAADALPLRYTAFTPCFRREAGAAGRDTRGLIRQHQFSKVELVSLCTPEQSAIEHQHLVETAEEVLKRLGLAYRVMVLSTGDTGFCSSKTYDIEVWLAGQDAYREISSCSNCTDFQARRAKIRFRPEANDGKKAKPELVHTLNGSSLAIGRTVVAVLENYQQKDGSVKIPEALVPYLKAETIQKT